jgi:hypothetical protein
LDQWIFQIANELRQIGIALRENEMLNNARIILEGLQSLSRENRLFT